MARRDWKAKNAARRAGKANGRPAEQKAARALRRTVGGAFGTEPADWQATALHGTTGKVSPNARARKKRETDLAADL